MSVTIFGVNKAVLKTKKQRDRLKNGATNFVKDRVRSVLKDLVLAAPQWSGNTAASWAIEVSGKISGGSPTELYREDWEDVTPSFRGDPKAWAVARQNNVPAFTSIRWNSKIRIINNAPFADELATMTDAEAKKLLRPDNYIRGDVMAVATVAMKYKMSSNLVGLDAIKYSNMVVNL